MVAIPMRLEDALRFNGYSIVQTDVSGVTIPVSTGTIVVPALRLSSLQWGHDGSPEPWDSFYLADLPIFDPAYQPVLLSHILDRFSTRRIGYNTPDMFGLAVRRWSNLNLGPMSVLNRMYLSTAVALPLDTQDAQTTDTTTLRSRDASSDFPQSQLSGEMDYASAATDRSSQTDDATTATGRLGRSVMELLAEQRAAYLNADALLLDSLDHLFLRVWDRGEYDSPVSPPSAVGFLPTHW